MPLCANFFKPDAPRRLSPGQMTCVTSYSGYEDDCKFTVSRDVNYDMTLSEGS